MGWLRRTAGGLPGQFWSLWAAELVNRAGGYVVVLLAFYLTQERGLSATLAGLIIGLYGAGGGIGVLLGGVLADRIGRRPTLLIAFLGAAATLVVLGFVRDVVALAALFLLFGLMHRLSTPALGAMITDLMPPIDRLRAFSLRYWAINVGFTLSALLAGLLAEVDYLLIFLIDGATSAIAGVVVFLTVRETRPKAPPTTAITAPVGQGSILTALRDVNFMVLTGLAVLTALVMIQFSSTLPIAMQRDGLSPATFGLVMAVNGVMIGLGQLLVPQLIRNHSMSRVMALASLVIGVGYGLNTFASTAWLYAAAIVVWTVGEMLDQPAASTMVAGLSPTAIRGRYQGVYLVSSSVAAFIAPLLGGWVLDEFGSTVLWLSSFVICALAAAGHLVARRPRERRIAQLAAAESAFRH